MPAPNILDDTNPRLDDGETGPTKTVVADTGDR